MTTVEKRPIPRLKKLVNLEATESWRDWLRGLAEHGGMSQAATIDLALRALARNWGYEQKPPRR